MTARTLHLVSRRTLARMSGPEKIRFILDEVKARKILVLQEGLHPREEAALIAHAMREIRPDGFTGIELESHPLPHAEGFMGRFFPRRRGLTLVGPAEAVRTLRKSLTSIECVLPLPGGAG